MRPSSETLNRSMVGVIGLLLVPIGAILAQAAIPSANMAHRSGVSSGKMIGSSSREVHKVYF